MRVACGSRNQLWDHARRQHAGQLLIETLKLERELVVIDTELVKNRRVEIADVHWILDDVVGKIVGFAETRAWPHAGAAHPHAEAARMVIAAVVVRLER